MDVEQEMERATARAREYYAALTGQRIAIEPATTSPLGVALETLREGARGREVSGLVEALDLLARLGALPEDTVETLDVRDPRGPVEVAAARACTWERLRRGLPVVSVHLARLGYVGSSAIRMAVKAGKLECAAPVEGDARQYLTAASAAEWLYQRQQVLARVQMEQS